MARRPTPELQQVREQSYWYKLLVKLILYPTVIYWIYSRDFGFYCSIPHCDLQMSLTCVFLEGLKTLYFCVCMSLDTLSLYGILWLIFWRIHSNCWLSMLPWLCVVPNLPSNIINATSSCYLSIFWRKTIFQVHCNKKHYHHQRESWLTQWTG